MASPQPDGPVPEGQPDEVRLPGPGTAQTITENELTRALVHVEHMDSKNSCASCRSKAIRLLSHVLAHREPEYEPGAAYQDAAGCAYLRSSIGDWVDYSGTRHRHDFPARPLRFLVPARSGAAAPDHGAILDAITTWGRLTRRDAIDLAARLCEVLGGECRA